MGLSPTDVTGAAPRVSRETLHAGTAKIWGVRAFTYDTMGMTVSLHVRAAEPNRPEIERAAQRAFEVLATADAVFSPYRSDSDLMRIRRGELNADQAHPWYAAIQQVCTEAKAVTGGLFTDQLTGPDGSRGFDPTGVVKGWAVDLATHELAPVDGITYCLNAAGDMVTGIGTGHLPTDLPTQWRVGISDPTDASRVVQVVELAPGEALATSGTSQRGAHIVDPRTGAPKSFPLSSVTVVGPELTWADVWATASFIDPDALAFSRMAASYRIAAMTPQTPTTAALAPPRHSS